jgi:predicted DNA-binding transcriptional regulator AlpA
MTNTFIRPKELCELMGCSLAELWHKVAIDELPPPVKLNSRWVGWFENDLVAFMAKGSRGFTHIAPFKNSNPVFEIPDSLRGE